jgi:hypothetical protein
LYVAKFAAPVTTRPAIVHIKKPLLRCMGGSYTTAAPPIFVLVASGKCTCGVVGPSFDFERRDKGPWP